MRKLFGTDGIRGRSNRYPMTGDIAFRLGQATALKFRNDDHRTKVIIGKDTRLSGYIFEYALTAGLCSMGADVYLVGPMPTPAIAHLTRSFAGDAGIVISASHNPADDNGIKFFDAGGYKLDDGIEHDIEKLVFSDRLSSENINGRHVGKAFRIDDASGRYIEFAKGSVGNCSLKGLKLVLDCANGAAYRVAPLIFSELGAEVIVYGNKPDGLNINSGCGSQCPDMIKKAVLSHRADAGIALDGDADRIIMVDEKGRELDGDHIMGLCALYMKKEKSLRKNTIVATVMSNMGFELAMKEKGIALVRTAVGDRYVIEEMRRDGYNLGGEQAGHIIFSDLNTTGDGTVAGLQVLRIMKQTGKKLSRLGDVFTSFPQVFENVAVSEKKPIGSMPAIKKLVASVEKELGKEGRVIVRYSGTENKCRVMVEGRDADLIKDYADKIAGAIKKEIGA